MKKLLSFISLFALSVILISCQGEQDVETYTVTFYDDASNVVETQEVNSGGLADEVSAPDKEGYQFEYWYLDDVQVEYSFSTPVASDLSLNAYYVEVFEVTFDGQNGEDPVVVEVVSGDSASRIDDPSLDLYTFEYWYVEDDDVAYDFSEPITADLTLNAKWEISEDGIIALINEDIAYAEEHLYLSDYQLNFDRKGGVNNSFVSWIPYSDNISSSGVVVKVASDSDLAAGTVVAKFSLDGKVVEKTFNLDLSLPDVVLTEERSVPFENLTTEYDVANGNLDLYFEEDGSVPYVKIDDFFSLLQGFVDPSVEFSYDITDTTYEMSYVYTDTDTNTDYDLILTVDTVANTISVNDPGFYWAYVYSTETNYGRHIEYMDSEYADSYYSEGQDIIFDLNDYGMDALFYEDHLVLPYYLVNQLFAGSSYYNVYYNYDGLYGIYSLPGAGSEEYETIKTSSVNNSRMPADLVAHNFNMLAFNLDHFYGIRDLNGIESYYDLLYSNKTKFLSTAPDVFDSALDTFIAKTIDEAHTSYGYPSYFNKIDYQPGSSFGGSTYEEYFAYLNTVMGPRVASFYIDGLYAVDDVISAKFNVYGSGWAADSVQKPIYWFVDEAKTTAVLSLNDFNTSDIEEDNAFNSSLLNIAFDHIADQVIPTIGFGDKFFYYNSSSQDENFGEILVKHVTDANVTAYRDALLSFGYTYDSDHDVYTNVLSSQTYTLKLVFDTDSEALYVGIVENEVAAEDLALYFPGDSLNDFFKADSAVFMEMMLEQIVKESPSVESVVLDLTFNTGGNVGALYRVVGFITDDPFKSSSISVDTKSNSTSYIDIDAGIPSYDYLDWGLLISPVTFSAANEMATIFLENDLGPIIGVKSSGGSASITPVLLPSGTAFTMSSNNMNGYRTGSGTEADPYVYHSNEYGIDPTYPTDITELYDEAKILDALAQYYQ